MTRNTFRWIVSLSLDAISNDTQYVPLDCVTLICRRLLHATQSLFFYVHLQLLDELLISVEAPSNKTLSSELLLSLLCLL